MHFSPGSNTRMPIGVWQTLHQSATRLSVQRTQRSTRLHWRQRTRGGGGGRSSVAVLRGTTISVVSDLRWRLLTADNTSMQSSAKYAGTNTLKHCTRLSVSHTLIDGQPVKIIQHWSHVIEFPAFPSQHAISDSRQLAASIAPRH